MEKLCHVFCCYAREDEEILHELKKHLKPLEREGSIIVQADIDISPGMERGREINRRLEAADIILLLISPDFIASDYSFDKEMQQAIARHEQGTARVVPVIIRPTDWQRMPFGKLQSLPKDAKPIAKWQDRDDAFLSIAEGIRRVVQELTTNISVRQQKENTRSQPTTEDSPQVVSSRVDEGIISLKKGSQALCDGGYGFAKKELRKAIEEIDEENQAREASKARYFLALALLGGKLPRIQGRAVMQSIEELMDAAINIHPYASYYRIFARIKKDFFEYNGFDHRLNEVYTLERKGNSFPGCIDDEENEEYFRHCQPRLQL